MDVQVHVFIGDLYVAVAYVKLIVRFLYDIRFGVLVAIPVVTEIIGLFNCLGQHVKVHVIKHCLFRVHLGKGLVKGKVD